MTKVRAKRLACGVAVLILGSVRPLHAQLEVGTWVKQATAAKSVTMTMKVETCCGGGRRLTYDMVIGGKPTVLSIVETKLDGRDAAVMVGGKPSAQTMAITRVDDHHTSTIIKMNGKAVATSKATLSADGKTLTVLNDNSSSASGIPEGKSTEIWVRK
jgi:hypothetical protein